MNTKEYISSGIIESYILGLASPEEAGILECVMKNNAEVKAAFEEAQKVLEDLATAQAVAPPADLKSKIWNKIQEEQTTELPKPVVANEVQPEPHIKPVHDIRTAPERKNGWKTYSVAATALFLVSTAANLFWMSERSESKKQIAQLEAQQKNNALALQNMQQKWTMISSPEMKMVMLKGVEKHTDSKAMVFWDTKTKEVYLSAETLPKAPEGMQYQLWAIEGGKPVSAGMYSEDKDAKIALSTIPQAQAFAITLEKKGGSEVPTMENMYVMGEVSS